MILFDSVDINSVAGVKIEDIKVSGVKFSPVTRQRAIAAGADFVRNRAAGRTVTVIFAVLKQDRNARQAAISAINAWAKSDKEYKLEIIGHPGRYLMAVCTEKPDPSTRQWWEAKLKLVFTCFDDPYWIGPEKSAACGTSFRVLGDAPPIMRIEPTGTSFTLDGRTMSFSSVPSGSVIDLNRQTAEIGGVSIMQYYALTGHFIRPALGAQTITGTGTVYWRERWA